MSAVACMVGVFLPMATQAANAATPARAAVVQQAPSGGAYNPVAPTRITDTRAGSGKANAGKTLGPSGTASGSLVVAMPASVPATATSVALSVTAVDGTTNSNLSVYPTGDVPLTPTSVLNYVAGPPNCTTPDCVVPNLVISELTDGSVTVANNSPTGNVDVVVDLEGYFDPTGALTSGAGHYDPLGQSRIVDTRCAPTVQPAFCAAEGIPSGGPGTVGPKQVLDVPVIPTPQLNSGVEAAVVQITATDTTDNGFLTAFPGGTTTVPTASNVNFVAGQTTSTRAIVPVGPDGDIQIYNYQGNTDVVVDLDGYFNDATGSATDGLLYTPVEPARLTDTRNDDSALGAGQNAEFQVAGNANIPLTDPDGNTPVAAVLNVTEASATDPGFFAVTPDYSPPITTSDVNFNTGDIRANNDVAELDESGDVNVFNHSGTSQLVIDAFGYFSPVPQQDG